MPNETLFGFLKVNGQRVLAKKKNSAVLAFSKPIETKNFYTKQGYEVFGVLEDRPIGTLLYYMKKRVKEKI